MEPITWVQPDWSKKIQHSLECYNVTTEEGDEDPQNINIHESEGQCKVGGPNAENPDILQLMHTK